MHILDKMFIFSVLNQKLNNWYMHLKNTKN